MRLHRRRDGRNRRTERTLATIYRRLHAAFGPQHWWPGDTPLEIAVGAILSQNTAWTNVQQAIAVLKKHRLISLRRLARLSPAELAPLIRSSGFYNIKAGRLAAFLGWLEAHGGSPASAESRPGPSGLCS